MHYDFNFRIMNANDYIKQRLSELQKQASNGYLKHELKDDAYTVRSLKPVTYRILHLLLHANLYMLVSLNIYKEVEFKNMLGLEQNSNLLEYLKMHVEKDFDVLSKQLGNNEHYIFIQAILYKLPEFLRTQNQESNTISIRNKFEEAFELTLVEPLLKSVGENIITYKNLLSREEQIDEIKLLLNEATNPEFVQKLKINYPLIKHMRLNQDIDLEYFESKFNNSNKNKEYPIIDLFIKKRFNLEDFNSFNKYMQLFDE